MRRTATRKKIQKFFDTEVIRGRGKGVAAISMYAAFIWRTRTETSIWRFLRIAYAYGYKIRRTSTGDHFDNMKLKER